MRRQKLAAAVKYFRGSLSWFHIFRGFIGGRSRAKEPRGAHKPARRDPPEPWLGGLWPPPGAFALVLKLLAYLLFRKNLFGGFIPLVLCLIFSSEKGQKHGKRGIGTWH